MRFGILRKPRLPNGLNRDTHSLRDIIVIDLGAQAIRRFSKVHLYMFLLTNFRTYMIIYTELKKAQPHEEASV
jgi:hypothetical protein